MDADRLPTIKHQRYEDGSYITGQMIYENYLTLWKDKSGWWWTAYGNDDDGFTLWDYWSLYAFHESEYNPSYMATMAEAGVRFYYQRVKEGYHSADIYGFLDWLASFSQSLRGNVWGDKKPTAMRSTDVYKSFNSFGWLVSHPPTAWQTGREDGRPYGWGNSSVYYDYRHSAPTMFGDNAGNKSIIFIHIAGGDDFWVPSGCAVTYWVDNNNTNSHACDFLSPKD